MCCCCACTLRTHDTTNTGHTLQHYCGIQKADKYGMGYHQTYFDVDDNALTQRRAGGGQFKAPGMSPLCFGMVFER